MNENIYVVNTDPATVSNATSLATCNLLQTESHGGIVSRARFIVALIMLMFLASCSKRPELNQLIPQALDYHPDKPYSIVAHTQSAQLLGVWGLYNESYEIKLDEIDYQKLLEKAVSSWKLQPDSGAGPMRWERIYKLEEFGVITISALNSASHIVHIQVSE